MFNAAQLGPGKNLHFGGRSKNPPGVDVSGNPGAICNGRHLEARAIANYVDTDFACCNVDTGIL